MLQTEVVTKLLKFTDVCARPSAKRLTLPGPTGPVNAVDVDGTLREGVIRWAPTSVGTAQRAWEQRPWSPSLLPPAHQPN